MLLESRNIKISEDSFLIFTDSPRNICIDTGGSPGKNLIMIHRGIAHDSSHLPVSIVISSGEIEQFFYSKSTHGDNS